MLVEPRPIDWGDILTLVGAIRINRWLTLATVWGVMNRVRFVSWVRHRLVRHLRRGDIVVLDNLAAHKAPAVRELIEEAGATLRLLSPYSHDFNPIEAAWARIKHASAPSRRGPSRRFDARSVRDTASVHGRCRNWLAHAGHQLKRSMG